MNIKIFMDGTVDEDWELQFELSDLENLYQEILWELKEYDGDCEDHFAIISDKNIFQLLVVLKSMINMKRSDGEVLLDLQKLNLEEE
jgi:hypothetical protein